MPSITITLEQLDKFLNRLNPNHEIRRLALIDAQQVLENTFEQVVMAQDHSSVVHIKDKAELKRLIKTRSTAPKGKPYNQEYLAKKRRLGEHSPHKFMDYGFWMGTKIRYDTGRVIMKTRKSTDPKKRGNFKAGQGDYLSYHETQRSVLKATFLKGWQNLINIIIARYAIEIQR